MCFKKGYIEENVFSNDISFTTNECLSKTTDSSITINFIKNTILRRAKE